MCLWLVKWVAWCPSETACRPEDVAVAVAVAVDVDVDVDVAVRLWRFGWPSDASKCVASHLAKVESSSLELDLDAAQSWPRQAPRSSRKR